MLFGKHTFGTGGLVQREESPHQDFWDGQQIAIPKGLVSSSVLITG